MLNNVHWAFEERSLVLTDYGAGVQTRRRAPDLVLPTGALTLGPARDGGAPPCVALPPGRYPVYLSVHACEQKRQTTQHLLFVRVAIRDEVPASWDVVGEAFTDGGAGVLHDGSLGAALLAQDLSSEAWTALRDASLADEPGGSLVLDAETEGNALVFATDDTALPLVVGRDAAGEPCCVLVVVYQDAAADAG